MKKIINGILASFLTLSIVQVTFAQNLTDGDASNDSCLDIKSSILKFRSNDVNTNGEVSDLQDFLIEKNLLSGQASGYYGRLTVNAVKAYQRSIGLSPTGNVGALTKGYIKSETCTTAARMIINSMNNNQVNTNTNTNTNISEVPSNKNPKLVSSLATQQNEANMNTQITYDIENHKNNYVLDVSVKVDCNYVFANATSRDCSQYLFDITAAGASESYYNVKADPYVSGGSSNRFVGKNGKLNINSYPNPNFYFSPGMVKFPDNIIYKVNIIDTNTGATVDSVSYSAAHKG